MNRKNKKAFTILELLVVLAVISAVTGLGIAGMVAFRQNVQLQEATSNFISTVRTVQNMARTGTLSRYVVNSNCSRNTDDPFCRRPDAYAIYFDSKENYSIRYCNEVEFAGDIKFTCGVEKLNVKPREFESIQIYPASDVRCRGIVFERLTGDISAITSDTLAAPSQTGECAIESQLVGSGSKRTIIFDLVENNIEQKQQ